jgi:hypothetical protein
MGINSVILKQLGLVSISSLVDVFDCFVTFENEIMAILVISDLLRPIFIGFQYYMATALRIST